MSGPGPVAVTERGRQLSAPPVAPGLALVLPRAGALTDALLAPTGPAPTPAVVDAVTGIVMAGLPDGPGDRVDLDGYRLDTAHLDPSRCRPAEPFRPSPALCRRSIGLDAVRFCRRDPGRAPASAVADILDRAITGPDGPGADTANAPWWASWYGALAPGAAAVVAAEAVTWATALWTALEWDRFGRLDVGGSRLRWTSTGPGRGAVLRARADIRTWVDDGPVLLLVRGGAVPGDWRPGLGFPALVAALAHDQRAVPRRVVGWWPSAGQVRITEVDAALLEQTADAVVGALAVWSAVDAP